MSKLSNPNKQPTRLAITPGDPEGIGPDIVLQTAFHAPDDTIVAVANKDLLQQRCQQLNLNLVLIGEYDSQPDTAYLRVRNIKLDSTAQYVIDTLIAATQGCLDATYAALVTGPVNKAKINQAGIPFTGHTEWLANYTGSSKPVMLLTSQQMKVALVTTHLPLREVADAITEHSLSESIQVLQLGLQQQFNIKKPIIAVCGLNPHAGDSGALGSEELNIITPTLNKLREQGLQLVGPVSADTAFCARNLQNYDAVLAMYHDQALPVIKSHGFGEAVNVTLGLPIIRTSVDHGTAYEIAGTGKADPSSLKSAIALAKQLCQEPKL